MGGQQRSAAARCCVAVREGSHGSTTSTAGRLGQAILPACRIRGTGSMPWSTKLSGRTDIRKVLARLIAVLNRQEKAAPCERNAGA